MPVPTEPESQLVPTPSRSLAWFQLCKSLNPSFPSFFHFSSCHLLGKPSLIAPWDHSVPSLVTLLDP